MVVGASGGLGAPVVQPVTEDPRAEGDGVTHHLLSLVESSVRERTQILKLVLVHHALVNIFYNVQNKLCVMLVDGGWSEWTGWSQCTKTCGTGTQQISRKCNDPVPQHGGHDCGADNSQSRDCNKLPCKLYNRVCYVWIK